jgi:hypothetical protein
MNHMSSSDVVTIKSSVKAKMLPAMLSSRKCMFADLNGQVPVVSAASSTVIPAAPSKVPKPCARETKSPGIG